MTYWSTCDRWVVCVEHSVGWKEGQRPRTVDVRYNRLGAGSLLGEHTGYAVALLSILLINKALHVRLLNINGGLQMYT